MILPLIFFLPFSDLSVRVSSDCAPLCRSLSSGWCRPQPSRRSCLAHALPSGQPSQQQQWGTINTCCSIRAYRISAKDYIKRWTTHLHFLLPYINEAKILGILVLPSCSGATVSSCRLYTCPPNSKQTSAVNHEIVFTASNNYLKASWSEKLTFEVWLKTNWNGWKCLWEKIIWGVLRVLKFGRGTTWNNWGGVLGSSHVVHFFHVVYVFYSKQTSM